jgi:hypothetical protein
MSYIINTFNIYLKSNNIKIITPSQRMFQSELNYNNFIICNDNEDLFSLLDSCLKNNKISFELCRNKIILHMVIDLPPVKSKNLNIEIPELQNDIDIKDMHILKQESIINDFNKKISELENKIEKLSELENKIEKLSELENKIEKLNKILTKQDYVVLPGFNYIIPIDTKNLIIIFNDFISELRNGSNPSFSNFTKYYNNNINNHSNISNVMMININSYIRNENYNFENIKYLTKLKTLIIDNPSYTNCEYNIDNILNIKYLVNLEELIILGFNIIDISFVKDLNKLKSLNISNNTVIRNIEPIKYLTNLTELTITGCPKIINLNYLTNPQLKITK